MIEQRTRLPRTERQVRHHEVDIEPHAHPGEPTRVVVTDHETSSREPLPRFVRGTSGDRPSACRDRF